MKALVLVDGPKLILEERLIPKPKAGEIVIKVLRSAICQTDFHAIHGTYPIKLPVVLGHEFSGEIFDKDKNIDYFNIGDRVVSAGIIGCGFCSLCRDGIPHYCKMSKEIGFTYDGGWQEYVAIPSQNIYKIPNAISFDEGALLEPLDCALGALNKARIIPGDDFLIIGSGPGGLLMTQLAKIFGARNIFLAGRREERLKLAKDFGANEIIDISKESLRDSVMEKTNNKGVEISIDAVGTGKTIKDALELVVPEGYVVLYGVGDGHEKTFETDIIPLKMLSIVGDQSSHRSWSRSIKLVESKMIDVKSLITHHFTLNEFDKALSYAEKRTDGAIKVMFDINNY